MAERKQLPFSSTNNDNNKIYQTTSTTYHQNRVASVWQPDRDSTRLLTRCLNIQDSREWEGEEGEGAAFQNNLWLAPQVNSSL